MINLVKKEEINYEELGIKSDTKAFERYDEAGLLDHVSETFIGNYQEYWLHYYNKSVDPLTATAFANLVGYDEYRVIPARLMNRTLIPFFNDKTIDEGYVDKNNYDLLIPTPQSVDTVIKCVRGNYFDGNNTMMKRDDVLQTLLRFDELIIKPSKSNNGREINKLVNNHYSLNINDTPVSMDDIELMYNSDYTVEQVIQQHSNMAAPHPSSVNTLRMVTLRWDCSIHHLLTCAKFGSDGAIQDNAGQGGLWIGMNDDGFFMNTAMDEYALTYTHHPTTGFPFHELQPIPNFNEFIRFVKDAHQNIIHHDFVSWDIAVGIDGQPIFIEANFAGNTWLYQLASQRPIFGELTENILSYVSQSNKKYPVVSNYRRVKQYKQSIKKYKSDLSELKNALNKEQQQKRKYKRRYSKVKHDLLNAKNDLHDAQQKLSSMKTSKSWRYTSPLRSIMQKTTKKD
ncbi:hypothetical protein HUG15_00210 [Salicibibacter cibarius]|uniref:Alpha-L-glutamate ligase-related protein ATP-grasp domain-containing protein n=1 Tax=Salicibibacter cibarius TaxID=2743000 RepID=A0A7T7C9T5_9BACI|nr:sugar-transfer associated ATP-grasp domain-containing protein [Salicibibacter cibarius]QQK74192.1 hypothetical protein HUG15_00210 [Salicibibacter cibarius]